MQTGRIVQAVVLMMIVAVAASCAASKEYTSKLFAPRTPAAKDSQAVALRFLELDKVDGDQKDWVTTDIITGRDTTYQTTALDNFAKTFPATPEKIDTNKDYSELVRSVLASSNTKPVAKEDSVLAKQTNAKKTPTKTMTPVPAETKPIVVESEPVARSINSDEVRSKRTREK